MEAILVPLAFFALIAAIVLVPPWLKARQKEKTLDTVRTVMAQGGALPPELWESLAPEKPVSSPDRDLRRAIVLIGFALGLVGIGLSQAPINGAQVLWGCVSGAAIPGFVGLGFLLLWYLNRRPKV